jgi:curved DNA-binding protein CbpA
MNKNKDYYLILGVYPGATLDVIITSYHILQRYYNSKQNPNNPNENNQQIAELNEAYSILSNIDKRKEYDLLRGKHSHLAENYFNSDLNLNPPNIAPLDKAWLIAINQYPDLIELEQNLKTISWRLSNLFKYYLLEKKAFTSRKKVAQQLENEFLGNFFSSNNNLIDFGKILIINQKVAAAYKFNKSIVNAEGKINSGNIINSILNHYSLKCEQLNQLFIHAAIRLEPELVKIYLKAGANVNSLVDGNQSIFNYFVYLYGFMRYRGNEQQIAKRYEIERVFYQYGAKKIDIKKDNKKKLKDKKLKRKITIENFIILALFLAWLIYVY